MLFYQSYAYFPSHDSKYIAIRTLAGVSMHIFITLEILGLSLVASISILNTFRRTQDVVWVWSVSYLNGSMVLSRIRFRISMVLVFYRYGLEFCQACSFINSDCRKFCVRGKRCHHYRRCVYVSLSTAPNDSDIPCCGSGAPNCYEKFGRSGAEKLRNKS